MTAVVVTFSQFMDEALYAPGTGFYERGGHAGRRGDFLTGPEVGPLFGAVVARALDAWWAEIGEPDPFLVDEHGAGSGTLARTVLAADPGCSAALRWTLVERSAAQRDRHADHLPYVDGDQPVWHELGAGPRVTSASAAPDRPAQVVLANELLDNLPFDLFERSGRSWDAVLVGAGPAEVLAPATHADAAALDRFAPEAQVGARVPLQRQAGEWLGARLDGLEPGGRVVIIDYVSTTDDLAARPTGEWLRTYRAHGRGGSPLAAPGAQDITAEVCVDQLAHAARPPDQQRPQAEALRSWGIDELVAEARQRWDDRTGPPDLDLLRLRSRIGEAEALLDPGGLGDFQVLEWEAD